MATYVVGETIRIKEVRGSPRPPAQWLGKRGKVRGPVSESPRPDMVVGPPLARAAQRETQYSVEIDGLEGIQRVPESWLAKI